MEDIDTWDWFVADSTDGDTPAVLLDYDEPLDYDQFLDYDQPLGYDQPWSTGANMSCEISQNVDTSSQFMLVNNPIQFAQDTAEACLPGVEFIGEAVFPDDRMTQYTQYDCSQLGSWPTLTPPASLEVCGGHTIDSPLEYTGETIGVGNVQMMEDMVWQQTENDYPPPWQMDASSQQPDALLSKGTDFAYQHISGQELSTFAADTVTAYVPHEPPAETSMMTVNSILPPTSKQAKEARRKTSKAQKGPLEKNRKYGHHSPDTITWSDDKKSKSINGKPLFKHCGSSHLLYCSNSNPATPCNTLRLVHLVLHQRKNVSYFGCSAPCIEALRTKHPEWIISGHCKTIGKRALPHLVLNSRYLGKESGTCNTNHNRVRGKEESWRVTIELF